MCTGATVRRTSQAPSTSTRPAPSAAASRAARTGLRRPENGARAGSWSGPAGGPPGLRERRPQVREPPLAGDGARGLDRHATRAGAAAADGEGREQAQGERLAVDARLEAWPRAGGTAGFARAGEDELRRAGDQLVVAGEQALGQADAPGHRLVQVDRRRLVVRRPDLRHEPEVPRVHHQEHRRDGLDRPPRADQRDIQLVAAPARSRPFGRQPVRRGLELDLREVDRSPADVLVGDELELLVQRHEARDHHLAVDARPAGRLGRREHVERLEGHRAVRVGVVVRVDPVDVRLALAPLEPVHVVLRRLVHVDRVLVDEDLGAEQVDLAQHPRPVRRRVDDHHVLGCGRAERDLRRREVLGAPVPAPVVGLADLAALAQERQQLVGRPGPEPVAGVERQLERGGAQVREQHVQVVGVEPRLLGLAPEQELGVVDHVLVHGRRRCHQDRDAHVAPPARATHLLPGGGDRARVAREHGDVEAADVHAQLERVGADHAEHLAVAQPALDRPALGGQVAAAVAADPRPWPEIGSHRLAQVREHDLDRDPRPAEDHGLAPGPQERERPALRERQGRSPGARRAIDDRRVHEQQVLLARRRAVAVDRADGPADQELRELRRVADGRGAAHDDRVAAVVRAQAQEPPQDVGDVAAEHAPVHVELVHDDHPELLEQLEPLGVVGEDRRVEHVGVGDHDLAGLADRRPDRGGRVAVVAGRCDLELRVPDELRQLRDLVLPEGLGREQEQGPRRRVLGERLQDGHHVAQRLARRRRGHDDDVLARVHGVDRVGLVDVRPLDAALGQPGAEPGVEPRGPVPEHRVDRGPDLVVEDAAGERRLVEEVVQDLDHGRGGVRAHGGSDAAFGTDERFVAQSTPPCAPAVTARVSRAPIR